MQPRDVLILGAGFSKAVDGAMPDLNTLKDRVLVEAGLTDALRVPSRALNRGYSFEEWLSALSEDQPYLSEQQNRANALLFAKLRDTIVQVLARSEAAASAKDTPPWLDSLVRLLHHREATVVTMNWDRLVEIALRRANLRDFEIDGYPLIDDRSAVVDVPPTRLHQLTYRDVGGWVPSRTMRLLKLHGSLDWWMSQGDTTGATLVREELRLDEFEIPTQLSPADRARILTGREVFLVPPVLTKTSYFTNMVTRQLWSDAFEKLAAADRVAIVGYSLPTGDAMMAGLMVAALQREGVEVDVVNLNAPEVSTRADHLGIDVSAEFSGQDCVADFVTAYLARADADFRAEFEMRPRRNHDPLPLVVTTGSGDHTDLLYRVVGIERVNGDEIVLRTAKAGNVMQNAARSELAEVTSERPTDESLAAALERTSKVVVELDGTRDGLCRPVRAVPGYPAPVGEPVAVLLLVVPEPGPSRVG